MLSIPNGKQYMENHTLSDHILLHHVLCVQTPDPECLFAFHAGPIQGLDVSRKSHLMATTTLDRESHTFPHLHTYCTFNTKTH